MCCVKFLKTVPGGSESTEVIEDEVISVHCQSIYNHERLPVNARVLVKPSFDQADADESRETAFRPATIEKVFEKKGRSKQSSYAYLVRFLDNMEYQRVNHEQVSLMTKLYRTDIMFSLTVQKTITNLNYMFNVCVTLFPQIFACSSEIFKCY